MLKPLRKFVAAATAPAQQPNPPAATMEWLRARCRAAEKKQVSFARIARLARAVGGCPLADLRTASQAASLYVPVPRDTPTGDFDRVNAASASPTPRTRWDATRP